MSGKIPAIGFVTALLSAVLLLVSGPGTRFGAWGFQNGLTLFVASSLTGMAAALLCVVAMLQKVYGKQVKMALAVAGLALSMPAILVVTYWREVARSVPPIHDISTDTTTTPEFKALLSHRTGATNPPAYGGAPIAGQQHRAYPDIMPKMSTLQPFSAYARTLKIVREMGWEIVAADPKAGRIEATDTTCWFGFKDDIVIRITPSQFGSRIDIRSLSRVGVSDVGTNAKRIRTFLTLFDRTRE